MESGEGGGPQVTEQDIANIVAQWTGIPIEKVSSDETERLVKMEEVLHGRVIGQVRRCLGAAVWMQWQRAGVRCRAGFGTPYLYAKRCASAGLLKRVVHALVLTTCLQEEAVTAISRAIRRARVGLKNPNRPIASFIFSGEAGWPASVVQGDGLVVACRQRVAGTLGRPDLLTLDPALLYLQAPPVWASPSWPRPWPATTLAARRPWCVLPGEGRGSGMRCVGAGLHEGLCVPAAFVRPTVPGMNKRQHG